MEVSESENRLTMLVSEVTLGMFISDVSCGWRNTPFLLEGLLVNSLGQIKILKRFAEHVTVDVARCTEMVAMDLRYRMKKLVASMPPAKAETADDDVPTVFAYQPGTQQFVDPSIQARNRWWRDLREWLQAWKRSPKYHAEQSRTVRPDYVPANVELFNYDLPNFDPATVPIAVTACKATITLLGDVAERLAEHRLTNLASLEGAAELMAEQIIAHPSALLWGSKTIAGHHELYQRSLEAGIFLAILGRQMGFSRGDLADLSLTGFLLDLGKTQVAPELLQKTEPLTEEESVAMRDHVQHTMDMLASIKPISESVVLAIMQHHERLDGRGYPNALSDKEISVYGKMAAVVDSYVAMTNRRPYAPTLSPYEAFRQLFKGADSHWHGPLVEQLVQAVGIFPAGSLVELSDGRIAIVLHDFRLRRLEPTILIITDAAKRALPNPMQEDLWRRNLADTDNPLQIVKGLADGSYGVQLKDYYFGKP